MKERLARQGNPELLIPVDSIHELDEEGEADHEVRSARTTGVAAGRELVNQPARRLTADP